MNLTQICTKYGISDSFLNSKDDALVVAARSITELVKEIEKKNGDKIIAEKLRYLSDFLTDVKNSSF